MEGVAGMNDTELIQALRRMVVETGSLPCLGCGHEHSCTTHGCAVINEAARRLEALIPPLNDPLTLDELRKMDGESVWVDDVVFRRDRSCGGLWAIVVLACNEIVFGDKDSMPLKDVVGFAYRRKLEDGTE